MLDLITKSKIRQKIILLFNYSPQKSFYINEVARLVKTSAGTARRELERLVKSGFLAKDKQANLVYYKLNAENPLLPDLRSIIDKTIGLSFLLAKKLEKTAEIDFAFLFGSYAKGGFKSDSDIDLYVIGRIAEKELHKRLKKVEAAISRPINYHLSTRNEFKDKLKKSFFHQEILSKYILIIGAENEFRQFIK